MQQSANGIDATVITDAVGTAVTDTIGLMTGLLPLALTVFATVWGVKKAMKFFRSTTTG